MSEPPKPNAFKRASVKLPAQFNVDTLVDVDDLNTSSSSSSSTNNTNTVPTTTTTNTNTVTPPPLPPKRISFGGSRLQTAGSGSSPTTSSHISTEVVSVADLIDDEPVSRPRTTRAKTLTGPVFMGKPMGSLRGNNMNVGGQRGLFIGGRGGGGAVDLSQPLVDVSTGDEDQFKKVDLFSNSKPLPPTPTTTKKEDNNGGDDDDDDDDYVPRSNISFSSVMSKTKSQGDRHWIAREPVERRRSTRHTEHFVAGFGNGPASQATISHDRPGIHSQLEKGCSTAAANNDFDDDLGYQRRHICQHDELVCVAAKVVAGQADVWPARPRNQEQGRARVQRVSGQGASKHVFRDCSTQLYLPSRQRQLGSHGHCHRGLASARQTSGYGACTVVHHHDHGPGRRRRLCTRVRTHQHEQREQAIVCMAQKKSTKRISRVSTLCIQPLGSSSRYVYSSHSSAPSFGEQLNLPQHIMMHKPAGRKAQPIFGAPLEDVVSRPDNPGEIPQLFEKGLAYLEKRALLVEGIFRLSGANSQIKSLKNCFDAGEEVDLNDCEDVHTVAGLLKLYLRELPEPLFPFETYSSFIEISKGDVPKQQKIDSVKLLVSLLPAPNRALFRHLFRFLEKVYANAGVNKMNAVNLSIVFAPNLLKDKDNNVMNVVADAQYVNHVVQLIIENSFDSLFMMLTSCMNQQQTTNSELKPLESQIAGHTEETPGSENLPRFLIDPLGYVYKPVPGARGERELEFYRDIVGTIKPSLTKFVSAFKGERDVHSVRYIGIEDLTFPYDKSFVNVADIKMGTRTYGSNATEEKIRLEQAKSAKTTTSSLGFRFCGAKIHNPTTGLAKKMDKDWGKKLKKENMLEAGIRPYFTLDGHLEQDTKKKVVTEFLNLLDELLQWFKSNTAYNFYSSSLLFVFGPVNAEMRKHHNVFMVSDTIGVSLKMIDFAHVDKSNELDQGYITGLGNLIDHLKQLILY
ncbi:RhoGAP domain-containing protein [Cavenderia fasciculata]|uniref:RhoGAP domain-containing protein n=1 Tax=Cavenderia fasciculata TaxID=261658 RepID=F4PLA2_CACFS|nr:RhoGAP domain-containing protein [Cavenderia fasciculata]EGG23324.1 RhoGAP domain-containing protein [Cavenderia fasciculata]|eukprot:XP_004361175.1 RhoGAP domain-containing protein [Cavenderia fasciculata]